LSIGQEKLRKIIIETLEKNLQEKFGLTSFRLGQREIIQSVMSGKDVLAIMPTGGGKSLCYQLPAAIRPGISVVVSPLISLMNDQVRALRQLGLPAGCIHSGVSLDERKLIFQEMSRQESFMLYVSPERVQKPGFAEWLQKQRLNLFAIDEAHCVSQWGHDFRPEYSQITKLRQLRPEVPVVALTATATPYVKRDIITHLGLQSPDQHVYGFYRPNLYYQVEFCSDDEEKEDFVFQALQQTPQGRVIVYCATRKKAEEWAETLGRGERVAFYHAGLPAAERVRVEEEYQSGQVRILAATNAFGMGIDHPDVRLVIHTQMPGNVESYYQEIGRAGRDGQPSTCLLLYSRKDKGLQSFFIRGSDAPEAIIRHRWQALDAIVQYSEGAECRHGDILTYFKDQQRL
jgi:ATP-dependent DNA helicase RecQ